ncbi:hypothetical protein U1Q18_012244, partial [Sarracenia purpurea var. burkii]
MISVPKGELIVTTSVETRWLKSYAKEITKNRRSIPKVREEIRVDGVLDIIVKPMGGDK